MRFLARWLVALSAFAAEPQTAVVTGRVFDVFHRPVPYARVVTIDRRGERLVPGPSSAVVDATGMYRLSLAPGSYQIAVTPPPHELDFCTVFPVYFPDTTDANQAQAVVLHPGEIRPFTDFLLLEVESHRLSGQVTGIRRPGAAAIVLSSMSGYTDPLRKAATDKQGRFHLDHIPEGAYKLEAFAPITNADGPVTVRGGAWYGSIHLDVRSPQMSGIRVQLRTRPR